MTPKELYDWAVEHGAEDYELVVSHWAHDDKNVLEYNIIDEKCVRVDNCDQIIIHT